MIGAMMPIETMSFMQAQGPKVPLPCLLSTHKLNLRKEGISHQIIGIHQLDDSISSKMVSSATGITESSHHIATGRIQEGSAYGLNLTQLAGRNENEHS